MGSEMCIRDRSTDRGVSTAAISFRLYCERAHACDERRTHVRFSSQACWSVCALGVFAVCSCCLWACVYVGLRHPSITCAPWMIAIITAQSLSTCSKFFEAADSASQGKSRQKEWAAITRTARGLQAHSRCAWAQMAIPRS